MEYIHEFLLVNGIEIRNKNIRNQGENIIYEVLRVIKGVPLFWEKHFQRFSRSAKIIHKNIPFTASDFKKSLEKLMLVNKAEEGNIRISLEYAGSPVPVQAVFGFIPHNYPAPEEYAKGVRTISGLHERPNPEAKIQNNILRTELNRIMQTEHAFEAILVHPDGYITEGSRSNIFFIRNNVIFTAPDKMVLSGITRENILQICLDNNYDVHLESLNYSDLPKVDAAFLTGTSPKVLSVNSIDQFTFTLPHPIIQNISEKYDELIFSYIESYKKDPDNLYL
jgi:branched-chain amino acid aminotransferase